MHRPIRDGWAFTWSLFCLVGVGTSVARGQPVVDIPASARVGAVPPGQGTGLRGEFYFAGHPTTPFASNANIVPSLAAAQSFMSSNPPTSTFQATLFDYPGPGNTTIDSTPPTTFLRADGASMNPQYTSPMYSSIYRFLGFINVTTNQTLPGQPNMAIQFRTNSDDGSALSIAGIQVVNNDGQHGAQDRDGIARFTAAGLYPIEIVFFNDEFNNSTGNVNLTVRSTIGSNDPAALGILPSASMFVSAVPEPGTLLLCGVGVLGMAVARRMRRAA
jgi:hypothetical protein